MRISQLRIVSHFVIKEVQAAELCVCIKITQHLIPVCLNFYIREVRVMHALRFVVRSKNHKSISSSQKNVPLDALNIRR